MRADRLYLFFDTETTGVNKSSDRIVQIAWLLTAADGRELRRQNFLIKPSGFAIPSSAQQIHGISTALASRFGVELRQALLTFSKDIEACHVIVAHNLPFDLRILRPEFDRERIKWRLDEKLMICTMMASTNWCRLPKLDGRSGYKWPKLDELHYRLFGKYIDNAHDAMNDVLATRDCFFELVKKQIIPDPTALSGQRIQEPRVNISPRVDRNAKKGPVESNIGRDGQDRTSPPFDPKTAPINKVSWSWPKAHRDVVGRASISNFKSVQSTFLTCEQCGECFTVTFSRYETLTICPKCHSSVASKVTW